MSMDSEIIYCSGCDFEYPWHHRPVSCHYHLPTGEVFKHYRQVGWCYSCDGVRDLEALPSIQHALAKIASLINEKNLIQPGLWDRIITGLKSQRLSELDIEITALQGQVKAFGHRLSGPRCLNCSSTDISPGIADHKHSCGGKLFIESHPSGIRFFFREAIIHMSGEGVLLDESSPD